MSTVGVLNSCWETKAWYIGSTHWIRGQPIHGTDCPGILPSGLNSTWCCILEDLWSLILVYLVRYLKVVGTDGNTRLVSKQYVVLYIGRLVKSYSGISGSLLKGCGN